MRLNDNPNFMNVLYLGHYEDGSTSKMRGEILKEILTPTNFIVVDINIPLMDTNRIFRSLGWRYKMGPLIKNINRFILSTIGKEWAYDLVWVDKGVFLNPKIIKKLSRHSKRLVHYTPDPAFTYHRSTLFYKALQYYDFCITTKSFEEPLYKKYGAKSLITCTQGFKPEVHKSWHSFEEKKGIIFIGHHEKNREKIIQMLLNKNYPVTIAGIGWKGFAGKNQKNKGLSYLGNGVFGEDYAKLLSGALLGLGLLSKIIPELHTTRTFEMPACKTALLTERNEETEKIYCEDEVLFYSDADELIRKTAWAFENRNDLKNLTDKGYKKVQMGGYDYRSILEGILKKMEL